MVSSRRRHLWSLGHHQLLLPAGNALQEQPRKASASATVCTSRFFSSTNHMQSQNWCVMCSVEHIDLLTLFLCFRVSKFAAITTSGWSNVSPIQPTLWLTSPKKKEKEQLVGSSTLMKNVSDYGTAKKMHSGKQMCRGALSKASRALSPRKKTLLSSTWQRCGETAA